jgi:CheY-like chemotaxis protein
MNDGRRLRILRVENHADTHLSLTLLLEQCGHAVTGACTMQEAFDLLSLQEWDVLLSDIGLPDGSGWGPMGRAHPRREPYAIAMSGYGMNVDRGRSLAAGFRHHLVKPMALEPLEEILQHVEPVAAGGAAP